MRNKEPRNLLKLLPLSLKEVKKINSRLSDLSNGVKMKGNWAYIFPNDIVDLRNLYQLFSNQDFSKCYSLYYDLDTDVRDMVNMSIANAIMEFEGEL